MMAFSDVEIHALALHEMVQGNRLEKLKQEIANGADINAVHPREGWSLLYNAVLSHQWGVAEYLLTQGASLDVGNSKRHSIFYTMLNKLSDSGALKIISMIVDLRGDCLKGTSDDGMWPIQYAVMVGNFEAVDYFLERKADINALSCAGNTTLSFAVGSFADKNPDVAKRLLETLIFRGADPLLVNGQGYNLYAILKRNHQQHLVSCVDAAVQSRKDFLTGKLHAPVTVRKFKRSGP